MNDKPAETLGNIESFADKLRRSVIDDQGDWHSMDRFTKATWENIYRFHLCETAQLRSQLEQVQSEAAVMRNALILIYNTHSFECGHNCTCSICQSISTTAGKEMLDRVHELEEGKVRAVAANDILDDLLKEQGDMIQQLQLDYSNLISANKVMSEKLTDQIQIYVGRVAHMRMILMLWSVTISKYESWKANNAPMELYCEQIIKDFKRLEPLTEKVLNP